MTADAREVVTKFNALSNEDQLQVVSALMRSSRGILQKGLNLGPAPFGDGEDVRTPKAGVNVGPAPMVNRMVRPTTGVCQSCGRPL